MKKIIILLLALVTPWLLQDSFAAIPSQLTQSSTPSLAPMLKRITPSIVNIAVEKNVTLGNLPIAAKDRQKIPSKMLGVGSGVIINAKQGLIATNAHVISDAKIIIVTLKNGERYRAKLIGKDDGFDIGIIKIQADHLSEIHFGDSDQLKVGNFVAAIGSPFGLDQTVTSGVISALNRSQPRIEGFQSFIQTDAPINPGNSGGALVDLKGNFIGMNTAIITPVDASVGIGFAIPSNMVKSVITQLLQYGKVKRGMLGVIVQTVTPDIASSLKIKVNQGTLVSQVLPNSPAAKAGIKVKDIIENVNGAAMHTAEQLHNKLGLMRPETQLNITVKRGYKLLHLKAVVADPNKIAELHALPFISGIQLRNFSELEGDGSTLNGVIVTDINQLSSAALSGLLPGDVITAIAQKPIKTIKSLKKVIKSQAKSKQLLIKVVRSNTGLFLVLHP